MEKTVKFNGKMLQTYISFCLLRMQICRFLRVINFINRIKCLYKAIEIIRLKILCSLNSFMIRIEI